MSEVAFQDEMVGNYCFGCGAKNNHGLQIKSRWIEGSGPRGEEMEAVSYFQPEAHHAAGPRHFLNGGIIATVIDCHAVCTAAAYARRQDSDPDLWFATASLELKYLRPTPLDGRVEARAMITEASERKVTLDCSLYAEGKECVTSTVVAVRVPAAWHRGEVGA